MKPSTHLTGCFVPVLAVASVLAGQQPTHAEEVEALRQQKSAKSSPDKTNRIEALKLWMQERKQEKLETPGAGYKGIRPRLGGLSTGSGFGFGIQYDVFRLCTKTTSWALVERHHNQDFQAEGAVYDRLGCFVEVHFFLKTTSGMLRVVGIQRK
jgi:hypothetical protein